MDRATFNALPVMTHEAANAGGVAVGGFYITKDLKGQTGNRVEYYIRIAQIRNNVTVSKVMPYTHRQIPGWEQGSNPPPKVVSEKDPFTGATYTITETITASGSWPSGAISYDESGKTVTHLVYPYFKPGTSQQIDGYAKINDVLVD